MGFDAAGAAALGVVVALGAAGFPGHEELTPHPNPAALRAALNSGLPKGRGGGKEKPFPTPQPSPHRGRGSKNAERGNEEGEGGVVEMCSTTPGVGCMGCIACIVCIIDHKTFQGGVYI